MSQDANTDRDGLTYGVTDLHADGLAITYWYGYRVADGNGDRYGIAFADADERADRHAEPDRHGHADRDAHVDADPSGGGAADRLR